MCPAWLPRPHVTVHWNTDMRDIYKLLRSRITPTQADSSYMVATEPLLGHNMSEQPGILYLAALLRAEEDLCHLPKYIN